MSATTYVIPQSVDGPSLAVSGEPTTSMITSPARKKIWRIDRPPSWPSRSRRGSTPIVASDSTVRRRSGDSSTTWSIARTPFACPAGIAATASDLVVGMPSRSSSEPSDGRPRNDHPTMPVPRPRPANRMRTPPIRQMASESTLNPACIQASAGSATSNSSTVTLSARSLTLMSPPNIAHSNERISASCTRGLNHDAVANLSRRQRRADRSALR